MFPPEIHYKLMTITELERLARLGDELAQDEVESRSRCFARENSHTCIRESVTKAEFLKDI